MKRELPPASALGAGFYPAPGSGFGPPPPLDPGSTYVRRPPFLDGLSRVPDEVADISGARVLATLLSALETTGGRRGMASLCIGGGEATAMAVELMN